MQSKIKEFIEKYKKERTLVTITITILVTFILVGGLQYLSGEASSNSSLTASVNVPIEFLEARRRAANASDKIANLTQESADNLTNVNAADQRGDYARGLEIVSAEIDRSDEIRDTALDLSEELRDMAKILGTVSPKEAASLGFTAVTTGIELVQRLISYNNNLQELFNTLQARLENEGDEKTRARIEELVNTLNEEAAVINNLSREYKDLMIQFDGLTN